MIMKNTNNYLSITEIAEILEVSRGAVNDWLKKGYIKYSLAGNLRKVSSKNLLKYLIKLGNSPGAMRDFERGIENYLAQKKIWGKQFRAKLRDLKKAR